MFLDYKNVDLKRSQNLHFPKGLGHGFGKKKPLKFFHVLFLCEIDREKVSCNILHRKKVFLGFKNFDLKRLQNLHVSKGVSSWFW